MNREPLNQVVQKVLAQAPDLVVIPLVGAPVLPHLGRKYPSGLYRVRKMWQYTNRGVGMARLKLRFNCRLEITVFTLEAE